MTVRRPAVFFDLDGTLVDTTYLHTYAWWRALDEAGEGHPMSAIHPLIGMGGDELLNTLIGRADDAISDAHGKHFAELHPHVRALPGATDLLARVKQGGGQVVIATSAKPRDLEALLGALGGDDDVDELVHGEEADQAKPAPDVFTMALERAGVTAGEGLAVGDSVWDVESAGKVGLGCVAVGTGGIELARLRGVGAVAAYDSCASIVEHWETSPFTRLLDR